MKHFRTPDAKDACAKPSEATGIRAALVRVFYLWFLLQLVCMGVAAVSMLSARIRDWHGV